MRGIRYISLMILLLAGLVYPVHGNSASISNSYLYDYSQPPNFQPSLNSHFTSLSDSITTVLANPAGLMKVNTFEVAIGMSDLVGNPIKKKSTTLYINDQSADMDFESQGGAGADMAIRITDDRTTSTPDARAIPLDDEYSKGGGMNFFGLAFRLSDNLGIGFSRQRPTVLNFNADITMPVLLDLTIDMRGYESISTPEGDGFRIGDDGKIETIVNWITVATSDAGVYEGFLDQSTDEVYWVTARVNNTIVNQQSVVITTGFKTGPIDWGINIIPMTYNIKLDNEFSVYSDEDNGNIKFLVPNFFDNPDPSIEVIAWATSEATVEAGYISKEIPPHPTSEYQIAAMEVAGQYSGSTLRLDLGAIWEPNDFFSAGFMYENFNGAKLILSGANVVHYAQNYINQDSEMPTGEGVWYPYYDEPTHEVDTEKYIMLGDTLPPIVLPSKLKFGFAFKKPILIAVDWEQWQNDAVININSGDPDEPAYATIKNLTFLKVGMESQLLFLPIMFRGSLTMLTRPQVDNDDLDASLDELFETIPVLPVEGEMYFSGGFLRGELGFGFGGGGLGFTQAMMADMTNIARVFFVDLYYTQDFWRVSYQMVADPVLTVFDSTFDEDSAAITLATTSTLSIGMKF